ncbi:EpsD family peptidyl-prolyl cis-trans isomerase [Qipengyuania thermophila]|uniref:EpsD family peptidyl-prolyl cis-trans isomerase n=1 Tax=Qipengyuania thermophila TaxID=2509361 RepID=UPI0013EB0915|nr:EpsD family peptidyl-prolyl cis-trans isomerase [Qipengyuania thermophila]
MKKALLAAVLATTALAACDREPTGQVAAVVNGEEITLQEINAELSGLNIPAGVDEKQVQQTALERIIERRLLANIAREEGVEQSPEYLIRKRQLEDALLVQLYRQRQERAASVPDQRAIDAYVQANPGIFAERTIYTLDRIQFPLPADITSLRALESASSMAEVAATLNRLGIQFNRGPAQMDSARLGEERLAQIRRLPAGEPFITPEGGMVTVAVITGTTSQPIPPEAARPVALEAIRSENVNRALQTRLEEARRTAQITYQEGFAPPARQGAGNARTAGASPAAQATPPAAN